MTFAVKAYDYLIPHQMRRDKTSTAGYYYNGWADPGADESSPVWRISREKIEADGDISEIKFAGGSIYFEKIWANRTFYIYS